MFSNHNRLEKKETDLNEVRGWKYHKQKQNIFLTLTAFFVEGGRGRGVLNFGPSGGGLIRERGFLKRGGLLEQLGYLLYSWCVSDSNARSHWLNRGHMDEFKLNVSWLVNISRIVDQPVNTTVARHV